MFRVITFIIPLLIAFCIFYFTKPSDERCLRVAKQELAAERLDTTEANIVIRDWVLFKGLRYKYQDEQLSLGSAILTRVRITRAKLNHIKERVRK